MYMDDKSTQAPEVKEAVVETKPETKEVATIGKVLETKEDKSEGKTVPEAAFLELKKANKALAKDMKALQASIESGDSKEDVSADIESLAEEHNIDKSFLKKFAKAIRQEAEKDVEDKVSSRLKPLEAKDRADKIEKVFGEHFDAAMAEMPEFKGKVNRNVIKTLSLDPANENKTFSQLIEETYGNAIGGKRTLEQTTPRGGKATDKVDINRAAKDRSYLTEVLSDPDTKKEYNEGLIERLSAHL